MHLVLHGPLPIAAHSPPRQARTNASGWGTVILRLHAATSTAASQIHLEWFTAADRSGSGRCRAGPTQHLWCNEPLERMLHAEPELQWRRAVDRLGHIETQCRALDHAEPDHVEAQTGADGVRQGADPLALQA